MKISMDFSMQNAVSGNVNIEFSTEEFIQYLTVNREVLMDLIAFAKNDLANVIESCGTSCARVRTMSDNVEKHRESTHVQ